MRRASNDTGRSWRRSRIVPTGVVSAAEVVRELADGAERLLRVWAYGAACRPTEQQ